MASETRYGSTGVEEYYSSDSLKTQGALTNNWAQVTATSINDLSLNPGGIRYKALGLNTGIDGGIAYPFFQSIKTVPVIGEVLLIIPGPKPGGKQRGPSGDYYLPALNIWNHPQSGIVSDDNQKATADRDWTETSDTNPLLPYAGDVILEGRKGQSIRLSENLPRTPWNNSNKSHQSTMTLVSGIANTGYPEQFVVEDINKDASSIYLLQDQNIDLKAPHEWKRGEVSSYGTLTPPLASNNYTGNQILLNSDRLYMNARTEHILLSAQQHIGLLGDQVHLDGVNSINLAAPKVLLTTAASNPLVRGTQLITELENLYSRLASLSQTLSDTLSSLDLPTDTAEELKEFLIGRLDNDNQKLVETLLSKTVYLS